jgi:hypothetical protein
MSSSNPSDPRLLLPDWLRDGDTPLPTSARAMPAEQPKAVAKIIEVVEAVPVVVAAPVVLSATPFSERLSLDTRLDPGALVSAEDLPAWLGGLEHHTASTAAVSAPPRATARAVPATVTIEDPQPYEGVDAPEDSVIDVQVNGWYMIAGAIGLVILLAAALRLYLS